MPPEPLRAFDSEGRVVSVTMLNQNPSVTVYEYDVAGERTEKTTEQDAAVPDDPPTRASNRP